MCLIILDRLVFPKQSAPIMFLSCSVHFVGRRYTEKWGAQKKEILLKQDRASVNQIQICFLLY